MGRRGEYNDEDGREEEDSNTGTGSSANAFFCSSNIRSHSTRFSAQRILYGSNSERRFKKLDTLSVKMNIPGKASVVISIKGFAICFIKNTCEFASANGPLEGFTLC